MGQGQEEIGPPATKKRPDIRDEHLKAIGTLFFDRFCAEHNVPDQMRPSVNPRPFLQWLPTEVEKYTYDTLSAAVAPVKITEDSAKFMLTLPYKPYYQDHIVALWPFLTLAHRPKAHEVRSVNIMVAIEFVDGVIVPINLLAHKDVANEPLDDAHVVHLVTTRTPDIAMQLANNGLDALHDRHLTRLRGITDPQMIAWLKQLIVESRDFHSKRPPESSGKVPPAMFEDALKLVSFAEQLFPGEVPANVKAKLAGNDLKRETPGGFSE